MQSVLLKAGGLYSFPNNLSEVPPGALTIADNVVIDRNGIIEPRRGFPQYGETFGIGTDRAKQLMTYKNRLLRHFDTTIEYDSGTGDFTAFDGDFSETADGLRMKFIEANGNFYFTTSDGVFRISAADASQFIASAGYIRSAGGVQALDVTGTVDYSTGGWFTYQTSTPGQTKVGYRITWAFNDANGNLVEGAPSSRLVLTNYSETASGNVDLEFQVPSSIAATDTQFFYRIYRTGVVQTSVGVNLEDLDPGDEQYLVIEDYPTSGELTSRTVTVSDITPESFRRNGSLLYTNPVSGDGILQSNYPPPIAKDINLFQNTVFYANTQTIQQLNLALLSVQALVSGASTVSITQGMTTNTYTFIGTAEVVTYSFDTQANTTNGGYFLLNAASNVRKYFVWFDKTGATAEPSALDTVGRLGIKVDISAAVSAADVADAVSTALNDVIDFTADPTVADVEVTNADNGSCTSPANGTTPVGGVFAFVIDHAGTGEDVSSQEVLLGGNVSPSVSIDETARSLVKNINGNTLETVNAYYLSGPTDLPGLILLQARNLSDGPFSVTADSAPTGAEFSPALPIAGTSVSSEDLVELNAIYYSKFQQPEAVPTVNKFLVGPKDKAIVRILPLRTGLMILKEDGIYRLTGINGQFNIDPFDNSAIILAADSAAVLNNQIYMFSTQGVVTLTDTGVSVISRPIEDQFERITTPSFDFAPNTFGVAYESDRAYLLWTVTSPNDDVPTQCFRFNTFTTAWTRWPISKTCGIVKFDEQKLYLGAGDANFIEQERKNFDRTDFADREFDLQVPASAVIDDTELTLSSNTDVKPGDVLLQTQFLTIYQFNQLLKMLDSDSGPADNDYYSTLQALPGVNLRDSLDNLANKLDLDAGLAENNFFSSMGGGPDFDDFQDDYNILTDLLNLNAFTLFKNYPESTGTITFDMIIAEAVHNTNNVTVQYLSSIIEGPVTLSTGIETEVVWAPQTFGDPSIAKHVSEGTFLFDNTVFSSAEISYASDLMPSFESVSFNESGIGDWSGFIWDNQNWGGNGNNTPLRTYIPRNKQYCRFLRPRFVHITSREKFSLLGASLTFRPLTERAYRG